MKKIRKFVQQRDTIEEIHEFKLSAKLGLILGASFRQGGKRFQPRRTKEQHRNAEHRGTGHKATSGEEGRVAEEIVNAGRRHAEETEWNCRRGSVESLRRIVDLSHLLAASLAIALMGAAFCLPAYASDDPFLRCNKDATCENFKCLADVAFEERKWQEGVSRLDPYVSSGNASACLLFELGALEFQLKGERAIDFLSAAAEAYSAANDPKGETWSLLNLSDYYRMKGTFSKAESSARRALSAATASGEAELTALVHLTMAKLRRSQGDLADSLRLFKMAEDRLCPDSSYCTGCLLDKGVALFDMGLFAEAIVLNKRIEERALSSGNDYTAVAASQNRVLAEMRLRGESNVTELQKGFREILRKATAVKHKSLMAKAHFELGRLTANPEARSHFERCVDIAREMNFSRDLSYCLYGLAASVAREDLPWARECLAESRRLAFETEDPWIPVEGAWSQIYVNWLASSPQKAFEESLKVLNDIEVLRAIQSDYESRARFFSAWADVYYLLSGKVLSQQVKPMSAEDFERAFSVMERLRSRVLLDTLERADSFPEYPDSLVQERAALMHEIVQIQRHLLHPGLSPEQRLQALGRLDKVEEQELQLDRQTIRQNLDSTALLRPEIASLADISGSLAEDEALLSFQIASQNDVYGDFAGGSWLIVKTRDDTRLYQLPDRFELQKDIKLVRDLMNQRVNVFKPVVALYDKLLRDALEDLPSKIRKLVIIPDADLHLLPFSALRDTESGPTLAERYQLSASPSATLWLRWRKNRVSASAGAVLALAAPILSISGQGTGNTGLRMWLDEGSVSLAPLEKAATEGRAVVKRLGQRGDLLLGASASEDFLKRADLRQFSILHFATHAVIFETNPGRSALLLAPGSPDEDGLLQFRDIVDLDLRGQLVVLSACQSATGTLLRGEGVLSLARAFFQAGAHTVIGSLWPLRDDEAARLFDAFYEHLAEGQSVAEALRSAQVSVQRAGAPVAAWAGVTVLGDGGYVPFPGGLPKSPVSRRVLAAVLLATVLLVLSFVAVRLHRRRRRPWAYLKP